MSIKSVLYVTTQIVGTRRYFSWCTHPSIWYARLQKKIVDTFLVSSCRDNFYVKFYPNDHVNNPTKEKLETCYREKILSQSLVHILNEHDFDLIVTEACATTLLEILCTQSQVLVFAPTDFMKLDCDALALLSRRAFVAQTEKEYLGLVKNIVLDKPSIQLKNIDDSFLFTYGMNFTERNPRELAAEKLRGIIHDYREKIN